MNNLNQILAGLQAANQAAPLIVGLIAMLKKQGDARSEDEIIAEALATAQDTAILTSQDMQDTE